MKVTKRKYEKPLLEIHKLDYEISLVMASESGPPDPELPPVGAGTFSSEQSAEQISTLNNSNFNENPFEEK